MVATTGDYSYYTAACDARYLILCYANSSPVWLLSRLSVSGLSMFQYQSVEAPPAANEAAVLTTSGLSAAIAMDISASHFSLDSLEFTADLVLYLLQLELKLSNPCSQAVCVVQAAAARGFCLVEVFVTALQ